MGEIGPVKLTPPTTWNIDYMSESNITQRESEVDIQVSVSTSTSNYVHLLLRDSFSPLKSCVMNAT